MKYYLVPVVDNDILLYGEELGKVFQKKFPALYEMESKRIEILYSTRYFMPIPYVKLQDHNAETRSSYAKSCVPTHLIAKGDDFCAREIVTGRKLCPKYPAALGIREVSKEEAENYFECNNYYKRVTNYFTHLYGESMNLIALDDEPFAETYEGSFYLDGELDGKPFKGTFSGSLKLKKRNHI